MFQGINPIAQIIIAIGILLALIIIAIIIFKRGIKLGYNRGFVSLGREECSDRIIQIRREDLEVIFDLFVSSVSEISEITGKQSLLKKMNYAESKLPILRKRFERIYYDMLADRVSDDNLLTENEDFEFYSLSVQAILYTDNGFTSVKSLLRKYLREKEYDKDSLEYEKYLNEFTSLVFEYCRRFFNFYYKSDVQCSDRRRKRLISSRDLYESFQDKNFIDFVKGIFKDVFDHAKNIDHSIEEEKKKIIDKRKSRLSNLIDMEEGKD